LRISTEIVSSHNNFIRRPVMTSAAVLRSDDLGKLFLRLAVGGTMLFHGYFKLLNGVDWIKGMLAGMAIPGFMAYGVYLAEIVAPILLILGYRARIGAILVMVDMIVAVFLVFRTQLFAVKEAGGGWMIELEALLFLASLTIFFTGGGKYAVTKGHHSWD
jgi:putative oxidoreductase